MNIDCIAAQGTRHKTKESNTRRRVAENGRNVNVGTFGASVSEYESTDKVTNYKTR
ncbi:hypothetical protein DPMN_089493 [Dreissena polymorpha]|uniref:Uncharacterized protein n=1 Tax=Dreissena polymorpha TaxID=45954 RepID=A0A9D4KWH6_DREPO|nr:hypothetical protein DPMN_089493 [Dreissena polymorpha]